MYKNDWQDFIYNINWFLKEDDIVVIGKSKYAIGSVFKPSENFQEKFPVLTDLLSVARVTEVTVNNHKYHLYGWTNKQGKSYGWLCMPPENVMNDLEIHSDHRILISCFGGIIERWNDVEDSWIFNYESALCLENCKIGFNGGEKYIKCMCEDEGLSPVIKPDDYISFAFEANGNSTLYHRKTGQVLMFAPDHSFEYITSLEGFPEYTLYTFNDCYDLREWVEHIAAQYSSVSEASCEDGN